MHLEPLREGHFIPRFSSFKCNRCGRQYSSLKSLRRHVFHCGKVLRSALGQYFDENGDERQFVCTYCNKAYRWKKGLKVHQIRCKAKLEQDRQDGIGQKDPLETESDNHTQNTELDAALRNLNIPSIIINNSASCHYQCILCKRRYDWLKNLKRHQVLCRKKYFNKQRLKECKVILEPLSTKNKVNITNPNFKCDNCGREYRWLKALEQHWEICKLKQTENQKNDNEATVAPYEDVEVELDGDVDVNYDVGVDDDVSVDDDVDVDDDVKVNVNNVQVDLEIANNEKIYNDKNFKQ